MLRIHDEPTANLDMDTALILAGFCAGRADNSLHQMTLEIVRDIADTSDLPNRETDHDLVLVVCIWLEQQATQSDGITLRLGATLDYTDGEAEVVF